jgi:hypothetical protein
LTTRRRNALADHRDRVARVDAHEQAADVRAEAICHPERRLEAPNVAVGAKNRNHDDPDAS